MEQKKVFVAKVTDISKFYSTYPLLGKFFVLLLKFLGQQRKLEPFANHGTDSSVDANQVFQLVLCKNKEPSNNGSTFSNRLYKGVSERCPDSCYWDIYYMQSAARTFATKLIAIQCSKPWNACHDHG